jgi:hypothetical protein
MPISNKRCNLFKRLHLYLKCLKANLLKDYAFATKDVIFSKDYIFIESLCRHRLKHNATENPFNF